MTVEQTQTAPAADPNVVAESQTAPVVETPAEEVEPSFEDSWMAGETAVEKPAEPEALAPEPVKESAELAAHQATLADREKEYADAHAALGDN